MRRLKNGGLNCDPDYQTVAGKGENELRGFRPRADTRPYLVKIGVDYHSEIVYCGMVKGGSRCSL